MMTLLSKVVVRFKVRVRSMRLSTLIREITSMGLDLGKFRVRVLKMDCKDANTVLP
jgi:hypothetical protein